MEPKGEGEQLPSVEIEITLRQPPLITHQQALICEHLYFAPATLKVHVQLAEGALSRDHALIKLIKLLITRHADPLVNQRHGGALCQLSAQRRCHAPCCDDLLGELLTLSFDQLAEAGAVCER